MSFSRPRRHLSLGFGSAAVLAFALAVGAVDLPGVRTSGVREGEASGGTGLSGRPTHVTDGDTLRFGAVRVRLHGVNAPEMTTPEGPLARAALVQMIGDGAVRCEDTGQRSYQRVVAICFDAEGRDIAKRMVREGWARDWPRYSRGRYFVDDVLAAMQGRGVHRAY